MADILIRGMEMPKNCSSCKIICWNYLEYGINGILAKLSTSESRDPNCPLVPLPEGHGRLGDLDALAAQFKKQIANEDALMELCQRAGLISNYFNESKVRIGMYEFMRELNLAETIVPAEGGTDNGD